MRDMLLTIQVRSTFSSPDVSSGHYDNDLNENPNCQPNFDPNPQVLFDDQQQTELSMT